MKGINGGETRDAKFIYERILNMHVFFLDLLCDPIYIFTFILIFTMERFGTNEEM